MESIAIDDVRRHLEVLKKCVRPVGPPEHPALHPPAGILDVAFELSPDRTTVLPSPMGLSLAASMKQFKRILWLKARRVREVVVSAFDDAVPIPSGLSIVRDRPGHASPVVTVAMPVADLVGKLETLSRRFECIGRIKVSKD